MKKNLLLLLIPVLFSCSSPIPTAQEIVDQAMEYSGTKNMKNAKARFSFRGIDYTYDYHDGLFEYVRIQSDTLGNQIKDVLSNDGFVRYINNAEADITDERRAAYTSSVNSVIYFAFLPAWLNDEAVYKTYKGIITIKGKSYYKIKVTFDPVGGGEDYEDVFYYWFDTTDYSMDYLAYSYEEEEGIGQRFRVAYNDRKVSNVVIQDYRNLKPAIKGSVPLAEMDQAYMDNALVELSLIETEDMEITFY